MVLLAITLHKLKDCILPPALELRLLRALAKRYLPLAMWRRLSCEMYFSTRAGAAFSADAAVTDATVT